MPLAGDGIVHGRTFQTFRSVEAGTCARDRMINSGIPLGSPRGPGPRGHWLEDGFCPWTVVDDLFGAAPPDASFPGVAWIGGSGELAEAVDVRVGADIEVGAG